MKKIFLFIGLISACIAVQEIDALAQQGMHWRGGGGWGTGSAYGKIYDPNAVQTVSGSVERIHYVTPIKGMGRWGCW